MNSTDIQMVFLDIDGTMFTKNHLVPSAADAVSKLHERDVPVAICTGRSVLHAREIQAQLRVDYAVFFNGGFATAKQMTIHSEPLRENVVGRIVQYFSANDLPTIFHTDENALAFEAIPVQFHPLLRSYDFPIIEQIPKPMDGQFDRDVYQVNVLMEPSFDKIVQEVFPECLIYRWADTAVDLQKRGCDKSIGAYSILEHLGIHPDHAVHIGDGGNDIGMFRRLGMSVAMGNASEDVKAEAKWVTRSAEEDGVYYALTKLGLIST